MPDAYARLAIREYVYWVVHINENQNYLGRSVIWCKRTTARDLADATPEEQRELFVLLADLKRAMTIAFSPDWFNYAFLGNYLSNSKSALSRVPLVFYARLIFPQE